MMRWRPMLSAKWRDPAGLNSVCAYGDDGRIESQRDSTAVQIELAAAAYDIRRLLEEAARWWNHASPPRG